MKVLTNAKKVNKHFKSTPTHFSKTAPKYSSFFSKSQTFSSQKKSLSQIFDFSSNRNNIYSQKQNSLSNSLIYKFAAFSSKKTKKNQVKATSTSKNTLSSRKIGLFGDIHFQEKGLPRIQQTGDWIIHTFQQNKVNSVICLGDVLNTRDTVSIPAQSASLKFFEKMKKKLNVPIHIILGNHDLHLKRDRKISSLDGLGFFSELSGIYLYRDIKEIDILGQKCLMIPYCEEADEILEAIKKYNTPQDIVSFGHLSINGAQIYSSRSSKYQGPLSPKNFENFKRTFSGHFHFHQELNHNVCYVGSPLQFNFGDSGDSRGIVIYDIEKNIYNFYHNPLSDSFQIFSDSEVLKKNFFKKNANIIKDRFVMIQYKESHTLKQRLDLKKKFINVGALFVKEESTLSKIIKQSKEVITSTSILELISKFIERLKKKMDKKDLPFDIKKEEELLKIGKKIVLKIEKDFPVYDPNQVFLADLKKLKIENFLGVQGEKELDFSKMENGIWTIEGPNGAGKSTILEAITWVQFGEFLRSDMVKDYAINDNANSCKVFLEFTNGFVIERSRRKGKSDILKTFHRDKNNELIYHSEDEKGSLKDSQRALEEKLGINMTIFSRSCIMGQNIISNFVSGSKDERRNIIEGALGLEKFNLYLEEAKKMRQEKESEIEIVSVLLRNSQGQMDNLIKKKKGFRHPEEVLKELGKKEEQKRQTIEKFDQDLQKIKEKLNTNIQEIGSLESEISNDKTSIFERAEQTLSKLLEKKKFLNLLKEKPSQICPSCGQPIAQVHIEKISNEIEELIQNVSLKLNDSFEKKENIFENIEVLENLISKVEIRIKDFKKLEKSKSEIIQLKMQKLKYEKEFLSLENKKFSFISEFETELSSLRNFRDEHKKIDNQIEEIAQEISKHNEEIEKKKEMFKLYRFWELVFDKRVAKASGLITLRRFVFERAIEQLNMIFESFQSHFGETRSIQVSLTPDLDFTESYSKKSGGERKRIDLITLFSLHELIRQQSSYQSQYIILDEVFDSLDKDGKLAVQNLMEHLTHSVSKVFVITHSDLISSLNSKGCIKAHMNYDTHQKPLGSQFYIL